MVLNRYSLGFARTVCSCEDCCRPCSFMPGHLIPEDLERLLPSPYSPDTAIQWAREHLLASPGAIVGKRLPDGSMQTWRIPTLVPARQGNGSLKCHWLQADGNCGVHEKSPFGCAFFDTHMPDREANRRSQAALLAVNQAFQENSLYARLWNLLMLEGKTALPPEMLREKMNKEGYGPRSLYAGSHAGA